MHKVSEALRVRVGGALAERLTLAVFFLFATVLGAYVEIPLPFTPVPLTLQTFFVLAGAAWLGRAWSLGVQATYLGAGAAGVSVFAGAAMGGAHLLGPTAGYLWAFLPASFLVATLWPRACALGLWARVGLMSAAALLILALGAAWLGLFLHLSAGQAIAMGVLPFIPGEAFKVAGAILVSPSRRSL